MDKVPRCRVVPGVVQDPPQQKPGVLVYVIQLLPERFARAKQVAAHLAGDLQHKRRFRLPIGVISREKIREELPVLKHGVNRVPDETGLATQPPHRLAV